MGVTGKGKAKFCFKCGKEDHISKDCKKTGPLKCVAHPDASSHDKEACYIWWKVNGLPVTTSIRSSSKDGRKEAPAGVPNVVAPAAS